MILVGLFTDIVKNSQDAKNPASKFVTPIKIGILLNCPFSKLS